ncbi:MAG: hypothetical protein ACI8PZ_000531 [Myxococcota bacterium]|jgi:hypothetical protein
MPLLLLLAACDPYSAWSEAVFPWVYPPEPGVPEYARIRWETETWTAGVDLRETALYLQKSQLHHATGSPASVAHFEAMADQIRPLRPGDLSLAFVGDTMWIGGAWDTAWSATAPLLDADLRIGNLETPTSPDHPTELGSLGLYAFNAPPEMLDGLPLDVLQLNNNHSLDAGDAGLEATVAEVEARGMVPLGVDHHATVRVDGTRVALLSYTWGLNERDLESAHELFLAPLAHPDGDLSDVRADVRAARSDADLTVVLLHWGFEYEYLPTPEQQVMARELVSAGADLVVGHGPHVVQPAEWCNVDRPEHVPGIGSCSLRDDRGERTAAVLYSLGNFGTFQPTVQVRTGIVATVSMRPGVGVTGLGWAPVTTEAGPSVVPLATLTDPELEEESARLDRLLGRRWRQP